MSRSCRERAVKEAGRLAEWRAAFEAVGELPRTEARSLSARFERATDSCRLRVQQQKDEDAKQAYANLFEAGRSIQEAEWAMLNGAEANEREALRQAAADFIAAVPAWPPGGAVVVKQRLATAAAAADTDAPARERALRMLCVRVEILKETATPAEDEALRREYQVKRLMQGMGQGRSAEEGDWRAHGDGVAGASAPLSVGRMKNWRRGLGGDWECESDNSRADHRR